MYHPQYSTASPYASSYGYQSPYYSPRYSLYTSSPSPKGHTRRATEGYSSAYKPTYRPIYSMPDDPLPKRSSSHRKTDHVSGSERVRGRSTSFRVHGDAYRATETCHPSRGYHDGIYNDYQKEEYLSAHDRNYRYSPPPPQTRQTSYRTHEADHRYSRRQAPLYTSAEESATHRPRARAHSTTKRHQTSPPKTRPAPKPKAQATEEDARRAGIPAGFSYKHWDPTEEPILLLGSVFDANSLGKWIYDWTVACHGPGKPITEVAGDLWILLIQLAGKVKQGEDCLPRVRKSDRRETIDDFLESGERLWQRFNKLLKVCEASMLKAAKKDSRGNGKIVVGNSSGLEFVDTLFGRDRELPRTEKLMAAIRLWTYRFDANCEDILRNPSA